MLQAQGQSLPLAVLAEWAPLVRVAEQVPLAVVAGQVPPAVLAGQAPLERVQRWVLQLEVWVVGVLRRPAFASF